MITKEIINYQFAERIKSALIIGSKMLTVIETQRGRELEGAKKVLVAFFDALSTEIGLALNATGMPEFVQAEEKVAEIKSRIEEADYPEAHATLGRAVSHVTTACERAMRTLMESS